MIPALASKKSDEWYTPARVAGVAQSVLGGIDLDPASCEEANQVIRAGRIYTQEENGLEPTNPWSGRVWLNPPYSLVGAFTERLLHEVALGHVTAAMLLVNAATETNWFAPLWAYPICFLRGRVQFLKPGGGSGDSPTKGSALIYVARDPDIEFFVRHASPLGPVVPRILTPSSAVQLPLALEAI